VVHNYTDGNAKANFGFLAPIYADGTKLPLILIARRKTQQCHQQFSDAILEPHQIWHSPRGSSAENLMLDYLEWLREQLPNGPVCLILDQYRQHDTETFQANAEQFGITILWILKGTTRIYQPLDRRVFGAFRSKGRAKWRTYYFERNNPCDTQTAAALLIASSDELSDSVIATGWNFNETPTELDGDDSPDDREFELDLYSDSDEWDEDYPGQSAQNDPLGNKYRLYIHLIWHVLLSKRSICRSMQD
jgi:hypothetical protein